MENVFFNNGDLGFSLERIKSFDAPISISKEFDSNLNYPYAIDIEDESFFYPEQKERDDDYEKLRLSLPQFTFCD
jgi:hypothetical protein